jgi:DNA damage-binding protein 1
MESFTNLSPICDFCVVDIDKQGQGQIISCSGAHKDGSLRIIRNGIGIDELGELNDIQGVTGIWSLSLAKDPTKDAILVFSFVAETRLQAMQEEGGLEEMEDARGFVTNEMTLACANVIGNGIVQVSLSLCQEILVFS